MVENEQRSYATNWVNKNDLYLARPDLHSEIENLDDGDMETIAKEIGDAVAENHDLAIDAILATYLGVPVPESGEVEAGKPSPNSINEHSLYSRLPDTPTLAVQYNGWNGKGDSIASARFTYLTFLWLTNDQKTDATAYELVSSYEDRGEAILALKAYVEKSVLGNKPDELALVSNLVRDIFHHEINWSEIANAFRD